ncbi:uncharacterized protein LOC133152741 isoform X3 [Syngnathus typhle]|uniref:uncharacterized protein LOC133152741 isoform X3 n=1 Tax=Syngnathus typhle TaxID=161592 RepID=UPI002A69FC65|nr:uncharacterized protein LOC133152741 isoform X3 [Syngnathus typhle]
MIQHVEAQPCRLPLGGDLDVKQSTEIKLQVLEKECSEMKEQNAKLIAESKLQLQHVEETVEEYSNVIKDLRLANQELRNHLEDREDEALLTVLSGLMEKKKESHFAEMSLAEELKLLATPSEMMVPSTDTSQEETDANETTRPPTNLQQTNCIRVQSDVVTRDVRI